MERERGFGEWENGKAVMRVMVFGVLEENKGGEQWFIRDFEVNIFVSDYDGRKRPGFKGEDLRQSS